MDQDHLLLVLSLRSSPLSIDTISFNAGSQTPDLGMLRCMRTPFMGLQYLDGAAHPCKSNSVPVRDTVLLHGPGNRAALQGLVVFDSVSFPSSRLDVKARHLNIL